MVTLVHTSDWHVGRTIRGRSRTEEHEAVLAEVAALAAEVAADVVLVTGDLFDAATPSPEAERVVYRALLDLQATGASVILLAGNHDSERRLQAVAPVLRRGGITVRAGWAGPQDGGVVEVEAADGTPIQVACLPFLSQKQALRAGELMALSVGELGGHYTATVREAVRLLAAAFRPEAVKVVAAHLFAVGASAGGSERSAHLASGYAVPADVFPAAAHYVALGHLHRAQAVGEPRIRYAGAPLQLDFGEVGHTCSTTVVTATPSTPAVVREVALVGGRPLAQLEGTLASLRPVPGAWVKAVVHEQARAGLADDVRTLLGDGCVDVHIRPPAVEGAVARPVRAGRSPADLLAGYLDERGARDERVEALFAALLEEVASGAP
ncbi:MAG: exonuclease subunit SbcD [Acidimicrobiales bacterium]